MNWWRLSKTEGGERCPDFCRMRLQPSTWCLDGHLPHLCCGWNDEGHARPFLGLGNVPQNSFEAPKWQDGANPSPGPEIKICQARLPHVRGLRAGTGQSVTPLHWSGVTFGKVKFAGYDPYESTGQVPQKATSFEVHSDVVRGDGQHRAHLLLHGRRGVTKKNLLACFLKRWEEENWLSFWKCRKASPPPSPLRQDRLGKGKWCLAGCTAGVVALEKTCFLLNAFCQVRESKSSKRTAASSWLETAACQWLPHIWLLHPSTPQFYPCTTYLHFIPGNPKWHLSVIPRESRTPKTLSPKWVFIMLCQEMSDSR